MNMVKCSDNIAWELLPFNFRGGEDMALKIVFISDGVGVVIRTVELNDLVKTIPLTTPSLTMKCKLGCRSRKQKQKN